MTAPMCVITWVGESSEIWQDGDRVEREEIGIPVSPPKKG